MPKIYKIKVNVNGNGPIALGHISAAELTSTPQGQNENIVLLADTSNAQRQKIECEVSEQEFNEIKSGTRRVFLWSMPAAETSILGPGRDRYSGLYRIPSLQSTSGGRGYDGALTTVGNQIIVRESAVVWTAKKMTENLESPEVKRIRKEPWGNTGSDLPEPDTKEGTMGAMGHPNAGVAGVAIGAYSVWKGYGVGLGGDWDLKPQLNGIWGAKHRYGNENWVLYYDVLSNIHYGYIGAASGMPLDKLIELAGTNTALYSNTEDSADYIPTKIGHDLFAAHPKGVNGQQLWQELKRYRSMNTPNTNWSLNRIKL